MFASQEQIDSAKVRLMNLGYYEVDIDWAGNWMMEHPKEYPDPTKVYDYIKVIIDDLEFNDDE